MARGKKGGSLRVPGGRGLIDMFGQIRSGVQDRAKKMGGNTLGGRGFLDTIRKGVLGIAGRGIRKRKGGALGVPGGRGLFTPGGGKRGAGRVLLKR